MLHPDKCKHPKGQDAFQKLNEAHEWLQDKAAWEGRRQMEQYMEAERDRFRSWIRDGTHLQAGSIEEEINRFFHTMDEALGRLFLEENAGWSILDHWWSN